MPYFIPIFNGTIYIHAPYPVAKTAYSVIKHRQKNYHIMVLTTNVIASTNIFIST